jgi:hypothetical protein
VVTPWAVGRKKDSEEVIRFQKEFFDSIELLASDNVSLHNHADFIFGPTHFSGILSECYCEFTFRESHGTFPILTVAGLNLP